jgi:hypothetical protein
MPDSLTADYLKLSTLLASNYQKKCSYLEAKPAKYPIIANFRLLAFKELEITVAIRRIRTALIPQTQQVFCFFSNLMY